MFSGATITMTARPDFVVERTVDSVLLSAEDICLSLFAKKGSVIGVHSYL